ncbi:MAG: shikimate kinase [Bacteroidia bacterium]|nr:shikimate kinase [Bacteroidia bacterium]
MGCGKSTHGKKLAKALKAEFIDLDDYISAKLKLTINEIFEKNGEDFFRNEEKKALTEIFKAKKEPCVISLGGGTICFNNLVDEVKKEGLLIYIETAPGILKQRLQGSKNIRPLLQGKSDLEILNFIKNKILEREVHYQKADITVNGLNLTTPLLLKSIEEYYSK